VEVDKEEVTVSVVRPVNNISLAILSVSDYKSKAYEGIFDALDTLEISFRYGSGSWIKIFKGTISTVSPKISSEGEILEVGAWGLGWCLVKTHCDTSYGVESQNPTIDTPTEVWTDLRNNYVQKSFGGAVTGHSLGLTVAGGASPTITYLESPYKNNFEMLNATMDLITADQAGAASHQWYVSPTGTLFIRAINATLGSWTQYWKNSQAASTLTVAEDMVLYDFRKNIEEYANKIVLASAFRKPAYDYWTENQSGLWGTTNANLTDSATRVVGTHSLLMEPTDAVLAAEIWYPNAKNAGWDFTKFESERTIPRVNFYARRNMDLGSGPEIRFYTSAGNSYDLIEIDNFITSTDKFFHLSFPVGSYYLTQDESKDLRWVITGAPNWNNINWVYFIVSAGTSKDFYIDDLHLSGKIVREAYNSTAITANNEYQRVILNDTAVNDSLKASDDSETAAQLVYAELLRRQSTPIVGMIKIPGAIDLLPGQKTHIHACQKSDGNFRIDKDMRVMELTHTFSKEGFTTILNLTDDVLNSHAFAVPTAYSLLQEYAGALGHAEAKNLKGSGIDILIPRLSKDYP